MTRTIEIVLQKGETLESAVRRFRHEVKKADVQGDSIGALKKHALHLKPGEKERVKAALARKRGREKSPERSALFAAAVEHVGELPADRQDEIAAGILAALQADVDPHAKLFQELVEAKYTRGLTSKEKRQMQDLETKMNAAEEAFYRPILERQRARLLEKKPRSTS